MDSKSSEKALIMTNTPQLQNDHQPKPLQNGFTPDFPDSEVDQSGPSSTEVSKEQLPQIPITPPKYQGDAAELLSLECSISISPVVST